ncbi:glycosyltransferase family 4 protein [Micromonospora sp. WMMD987]|uniref:glycosyltransferase n=1 Tax=Micromonospora sp. WMMD987 TaxID=3016089 RepID=UPI00249BA2CC|nr:glycosyltransferase family 4 protein [Micromonospora sp. WMMD987]WFE96503.1 glycosyltransferase family 4 protein [Micromonospora sp. WMMD987]
MRLAFFDDYGEVPGHHPDHIVGLGRAARAPIYCPDGFLEGRRELTELIHHPVTGDVDRTPGPARTNLETACADAVRRGADVLVNLFLDENWDAFPIARHGIRMAHTLHRPGAIEGTMGGINAVKQGDAVGVLRRLAPTDPIVVHTSAGLRQASRWIPADRIVHLGWPAATGEAIRRRFAAAGAATTDDEPYVLLIGRGNRYKGIRVLLEAVGPGDHRLRIGGKLEVPGDADWLAEEFPRARVSWEPGWVDDHRLDQLIAGAAVVVFPYLSGFEAHGGVSGALVHALTFAKPIVVTEELRTQLPELAASLVVPTGDATALKAALDRVMADPRRFAQPAELEKYLVDNHSYERHVEQMINRFADH